MPSGCCAHRLGTHIVCHPTRQEENRKALLKAADNGKTEVVRRYIGMGVDVDWQDGVSVCATHEGTALFHGERSRTRELIRG